jgi:hypothetical protein
MKNKAFENDSNFKILLLKIYQGSEHFHKTMGCIQHNGVHHDVPRDLIIVDMLNIR